MCVLEMIAREEPYLECKGSASLLAQFVTSKVYPLALSRVSSKSARDFISMCLRSADDRPSAAELLQHEFLEVVTADDEEVKLGK